MWLGILEHRPITHQVEAPRLAAVSEGVVIVIEAGGEVEPWLQVMLQKVWPDVLGAAWATCLKQGNAIPCITVRSRGDMKGNVG